MSDKQDELRPIIIKKVKKMAGGHHGGAWKVAYADFVTAMMAFFLLLWLLSVTTEVQKEGIADYFTSVPMITRSESGASGLLGGTTVSPDGAMTSTVQPLVHKPQTENPTLRPGSQPIRKETEISDKRFEEERQKREAENFEQAEAALKQAIESDADFKALAEALYVDTTPEGLRIQVVDQTDKPLFDSGSAKPLLHTRKLLKKVSGIIQRLPNEVSVRGHTDSVGYGEGATYTNWELSAERANAARRELIKGGMPKSRLNNVVGKADTDHLFPDNTRDERNRRISIILLYERVTTVEGANKSSRAIKREEDVKEKLYKRSEGKIEFP